MRDIANNEEDVEVVYHHISHGEIVNPQDLVDEVPDNLLDDDEYAARHAEDEEDGSEDEEEEESDDSENDGDDDAESVSEEVENIEVNEPVEVETENVDVIEPVEVNLKTFKELDADHVKLTAKHEKLKADYENLKEEYENLKYDYKELKAECNTLEAEKEMLEKWLEETRSKKSGSTSDKDFSDEAIEVTEATQEAKVYYTRARGTTNVGIRVESPIVIPDEAAETVNFDKAEGKRKLDAVPEITEEASVLKKARTDETVQIEPIQSVTVAETEVVEMAKVDETVIEAEVDKTVQIEPIQSESVLVERVSEVVEMVGDVPETMTEEVSQFEPVQTDNAPMIEALDDLDDIDFTESEPEAEHETNPDDEIPADLPERFAYLEKMKYNPVYLNGLTV
ncbi:hypothetical protein QVD17_30651 [Tagetes erecta]|uniref:Uncharacterized protein n=1 Tax=Tagetes erecta TaxID=13708 RepID=A0AAD8NMF4_TARER|nr:hypothetical protein QVD17_30651 [Tagetes erecta]